MICPKCEEGNINEVKLKSTGKKAFLCDFCDALWIKGEVVNFDTGHSLQSFSRGEEIENIAQVFNEPKI